MIDTTISVNSHHMVLEYVNDESCRDNDACHLVVSSNDECHLLTDSRLVAPLSPE